MDKYFKFSKAPKGGMSIWVDGSPASIVLNTDFFESAAPSGNTYNEVITLSSSNVIDFLNQIDFNGAISLINENQIALVNSLLAENNISINSDSSIVVQGGLDMNAETSLITENSFLEQGLSDYLSSTIFISDLGIEVTATQITELALSLISATQVSVDNNSDFINSIEIQMNNDVLFSLFLDCYNELLVSSDVVTTFDVVNVISSNIGLDISVDAIFEIANFIDSFVSISSFNDISVSDELIIAGNSYDEYVSFNANCFINFFGDIELFMKITGALFIKNINKIKG